jgi:hypothetical protein
VLCAKNLKHNKYSYTFAQQLWSSLVKSQRCSWQSQKRELENQLKKPQWNASKTGGRF